MRGVQWPLARRPVQIVVIRQPCYRAKVEVTRTVVFKCRQRGVFAKNVGRQPNMGKLGGVGHGLAFRDDNQLAALQCIAHARGIRQAHRRT